jgi:hypothetical protein
MTTTLAEAALVQMKVITTKRAEKARIRTSLSKTRKCKKETRKVFQTLKAATISLVSSTSTISQGLSLTNEYNDAIVSESTRAKKEISKALSTRSWTKSMNL